MASNPLIVRPGTQIEYGPTEMREMRRCAQDPIYFIRNYVKVQHPTKGIVPLDLYDFQEDMVRTYKDNTWCITLTSRQVGKTTTAMAFLLWYACFNDDKTVLVASNRKSNALEIIDRIRTAYEYLPAWLKPAVTDDGWNKLSVCFDNGSRILSDATTEKTGRGLSISLLMCDEFAFVKKNIQELFWGSILPTLSTGGACIICSTPVIVTGKQIGRAHV